MLNWSSKSELQGTQSSGSEFSRPFWTLKPGRRSQWRSFPNLFASFSHSSMGLFQISIPWAFSKEAECFLVCGQMPASSMSYLTSLRLWNAPQGTFDKPRNTHFYVWEALIGLCGRVYVCWVTSVLSNSLTQWAIACQAPLSIKLSRQEYWSGLPSLSPGDLPDPGVEPGSPTLQADSLPSEPLGEFTVEVYKDIIQPMLFKQHTRHHAIRIQFLKI